MEEGWSKDGVLMKSSELRPVQGLVNSVNSMEEESQLPEDGVMTSPARQVNLSVTVPRIDGLVSSVSVGQYLNKAEDFPDGKFGIHKSQSINHLTSINETDRLYRNKEKRKKAARLSRGFLEFISLVDLAKPVEKEEKKRSTKDQSTPNLEVVTEPAESSSNISDESPVIRQRRPVERRERRTTVGTEAGLLGLHHSLSTKTGKLREATSPSININISRRKTTTPSINGDFSMSTPSLTLAGKTDIPPRSRPQTSKREAPVVPRVQAPPLPQWKSVLDTRIQMDVDTMFQNIMTDSDLYRAWINCEL
ncbi:uncharacterized protein LOC111709838 [Eurytemora carolleeae]|uniref:uncharacterized protein LOC111709838 n=1 Tax=Eurytemora carolleeae TaxID=1294199 RepID=UPI000C76F4A7|nr:uncharacterized protein LOC111709838 [Eurytemora carolleeae]|eukprot:XP_023339523.1 uncharacterized protein LOC111709838 [Eurytemora affinis]